MMNLLVKVWIALPVVINTIGLTLNRWRTTVSTESKENKETNAILKEGILCE